MRRLTFFLTLITIFLFCTTRLLLSQTNSIRPSDSLTATVDTTVYEVGEVVVTGTRYQKKIIDIPYSVMRFNTGEFRYDRKVAIDDVLETVPGLFLQSRYGNHDVRISIRGFGSRSNTGIRGVRILLDGIPESEPDGQTRIEAIDFNSVGRIEIMKGNASSLYTNAPGGVINFINDVYFPSTFAVSFNEFGSFGLRRNGFKTGIRTKDYTFLLTYSYHNYNGFRNHSEDYWHIVNTVLETAPNNSSSLQVLGYFVDGLIRLPGSLTKAEFEADPFQAAQREVDFDFRRVSKKGRVGLRFNSYLDEDRNNQIELTTYGTIKYFERTSRVYRIINRYGLGASGRYVNKSRILGRNNEFSFGGDLFYQSGPIEFYTNINGQKSDNLTGLTDETIVNTGFYFQNSFNLVKNKMDLLITGRYDKVVFDQKNQILAVQNDKRRFEAFTPKAALNYKLTPYIALYTSYGLSFDTPAGNELDNYPTSSQPGKLLNPDLQPQESKNFEVGIKGSIARSNAPFLADISFETTFFHYLIDDEVVPFEVFSDVFFRNSAQTVRNGLEVGGSAAIFPGLKLNFAYTYSDFSYDQYTAASIEFDQGGNIVTVERNYSGNIVPSVPEQNLSASLAYERSLTAGLTGFVKTHYWGVSGMYVDDANSEKTAGYRVVNSLLGLDVRLGGFNCLVSGGVNNMLDERYVAFININSISGRFYEVGAPRSYFASIRLGYRF